ncbi:putative P-loop ATPase [Paraburkholderia sp. GAS38]|uniref:VapE domain-containing protein n=1 Tax=Paraburkholderia sp. GAS38 TaxID=3035133 RepID=UPI003D204302
MEKKATPKADDPDVFANIKPRDRRTLVKASPARTPIKKPAQVSRIAPETQTPVEKPVPAAIGERPALPLELSGKDGPATISDVCVFLRLNGISEVLAYDEFANKLVVLATDKWGLPVGEISDELVVSIVILMQQVDITVTANGVRAAVAKVARETRMHLVRDKLNGLNWRGKSRGKSRVNTWLPRVLGVAADDPDYDYLCAVGKKWLLGMVARALSTDPGGIALPATLVFSSTRNTANVLEALAVLGGAAFSDSLTPGDLKHANPLHSPAWIVALFDFAEFVEKESLRSFLAATTDTYQATHDSKARRHARGFVPVGVTRDTEYLKQAEGYHLWPVNVVGDGFNMEWLRENRGQLLAEAVHRYRQGERWEFDPVEDRAIIDQLKVQRSARQYADSWEEAIERYLDNVSRNYRMDRPSTGWVRMADILEAVGVSKSERLEQRHMRRAGRIMRQLGWENKKGATYGGGVVWVKPGQ